MSYELFIIFIYLIFSLFLSALIVFIAMLLVNRTGDIEKILFIIFDLEITFLFPWSIKFEILHFFGYVSMIIFIYILLIGFIYEWKKGALEWS